MTKKLSILCMMPLFADGGVALASYRSFQVDGVRIYTINDNAKPEVLAMIRDNGLPIDEHNTEDGFATGCWNQAFRYFMEHPEYDVLRVGFSDVIMQENW